MPRLIFAILFVLAACAPRLVSEGGVYRLASAPVYSNAAFDTARLDGTWDQVAAFAIPAKSDCAPGTAEFSGKPGNMRVTYRLCLSGQVVAGAGAITSTGPGRFGVAGKDGIGQDWWVLWVDSGYRTMAIGNPSGTFGFILNRGTVLPKDRLIAAKEIFDFNGYDTAKLTLLKK